MNKITLRGHLGKDPEVRRFENGKIAARFTLATKRSWKDVAGEWVNETDWHQIKAWGKIAEKLYENLRKGNEVVIFGRLAYDKWEDDNGVKKTFAYVLASDYIKGEIKGDGWAKPPEGVSADRYSKPEEKESKDEVIEADDDLPF